MRQGLIPESIESVDLNRDKDGRRVVRQSVAREGLSIGLLFCEIQRQKTDGFGWFLSDASIRYTLIQTRTDGEKKQKDPAVESKAGR